MTKKLCVSVALAVTCLSSLAAKTNARTSAAQTGNSADVASATAPAIAVDTRGLSEWYARAGDALSYGPYYAAEDGASVKLWTISRATTGESVTNLLKTCGAGESGTLELGAAEAAFGRFTLLHEVLDGEGVRVGLLEKSVSTVAAEGSGTGVFCDTTTNSIEHLVEIGRPLPIVYSTDWTNGDPASLEILCERTRSRHGRPVECTTSVVYQASAPADGTQPTTLDVVGGGRFRLTCTFLDGAGQPMEPSLTALARWKDVWGSLLLLR